uniref:Uncharacterized protein n=1 Tax=Oryza glaberrima TaxID=4538 RepID=I1QGY8_ORYGL
MPLPNLHSALTEPIVEGWLVDRACYQDVINAFLLLIAKNTAIRVWQPSTTQTVSGPASVHCDQPQEEAASRRSE